MWRYTKHMEFQSISGPARNVSELVTNKPYLGISLAYRHACASELLALVRKHARFVIHIPAQIYTYAQTNYSLDKYSFNRTYKCLAILSLRIGRCQ